jgi:hypothetical protein
MYIIEKEPYIIEYNSVIYKNCYATNTDGTMILGNMGLQGGEDTGEPFVIMFPTPTQAEELGMSGVTAVIITSDNATELNMIIKCKEIEKIEKLDPRFLPDRNTPIVFKITPNEDGTGANIHCDLTMATVVSKLNADPTIPIIVLLGDDNTVLHSTNIVVSKNSFNAYFINIFVGSPYFSMYELSSNTVTYNWKKVTQ